ncbi:MAG: hypothetical protein IKW62_00075 [Clostridia bacterium]|nr:hypothetical protein [Clostridia bacterium]
MKIAYIGIDLFYPALEKLKELGCEIIEIFTCEVDNVCEFNLKICDFAREYNIPLTKSRISREDIKRLLDKGCKAAICGGYYFKIPHDTALPIVNIHPSLLPDGRGSWPMAQSILWRHKKSGVTIHKIAQGFDTGDILLQSEFLLDEDETHQTFMQKANLALSKMLPRLVEDFDRLYRMAISQPEGMYWKAPTEEDYTITPQMSVEEADLILRAFYGYECIYKKQNKKEVIIGGRAVLSDDLSDKSFTLKNGYISF